MDTYSTNLIVFLVTSFLLVNIIKTIKDHFS